MPRTVTTLLALLVASCLEVSSDPHQPGGAIPLPSKVDLGSTVDKPSLEEIQARFPTKLTSPVLVNDLGEPLPPTAPLDPIAPSEPVIPEPEPNLPRFVTLQQDWEAKGCSSVGQCHDQEERTIVVKMSPDAERLFLNWAQIAPPEAGGVGVAAEGSVNHFAGGDSAGLWQSWRTAGYPFIE